MNIDQLIQTASLAALPVLFAMTLREVAHGYAAKYFGDMTAYQEGRLSLNPVHHIDLLGTIILPIMTLLISPIMFGWAKPVPVNYGALRKPKQDMRWVALAGPAANLVMALIWAILAKAAILFPENYFAQPLYGMAQYGIQINVVLVALHLLPIPPLDGGRIAISLLPHKQAYQFAKLEPYGMFIIILLAFTSVLWMVMKPVMGILFYIIQLLFGL